MFLTKVQIMKHFNLKMEVFPTLLKAGLRVNSKKQYDTEHLEYILSTMDTQNFYKDQKTKTISETKEDLELLKNEYNRIRLDLYKLKLREYDKNYEDSSLHDEQEAEKVQQLLTFLRVSLKILPQDLHNIEDQKEFDSRVDSYFRKELQNHATPLNLNDNCQIELLLDIEQKLLKNEPIDTLYFYLKNLIYSR